MKIISNAERLPRSSRATVFPLMTSRNRKSGARVPSGSIVELTATIAKIWNGPRTLSNQIKDFDFLSTALAHLSHSHIGTNPRIPKEQSINRHQIGIPRMPPNTMA